jgi:antitoxin MazE
MTTLSLNIKQWGNSLGVRLPAAIAKAVGLQADQCVQIAVKGQSVVITPCKHETMTLEERLSRFDPDKHGAEVMPVDQRLGAEKW